MALRTRYKREKHAAVGCACGCGVMTQSRQDMVSDVLVQRAIAEGTTKHVSLPLAVCAGHKVEGYTDAPTVYRLMHRG